MADQKDEHSDPPAEDPTIIPLMKRSMAEKSLPGFNRAPKSMSESDSDSDSESSDSDDDKDFIDKIAEEFKKKKLEELKRKAFYSVLLAFKAETLTIEDNKTQIIEKMMKEWNISPETCSSFEDHIQKNLIAHKEWFDLDVVEKDIVESEPLTISEKKPTLFPTSVATPRSSWGSVTPEALVGRRVRIKLPCEYHFEDLVIKEYNAKDGTHRLETADSDATWIDDMLSWVDLREVPPEDIIWRDGENPNFEAPGLSAGQ